MTMVEPDISVELSDAVDNANTELLQALGIGGLQGGATSTDYSQAIAIGTYAFPGIVPPAAPNATRMATYLEEQIEYLSAEAVMLYQGSVTMAGAIDANTQAAASVKGDVIGLQGYVLSGPPNGQLQEEINSLNAGVAATAGASASTLAAANAYSDALYNRAIAYANVIAGDALTWANSAVSQANSHSDALYNEAINYANVIAGDALTWANSAVTQSKAYADTLYNRAISYANTVAGDALTWANSAVTQAKTYTDAAVATGMAGAAASAVTQVMTAVQPQLDKVKTDIATCLDPLCDTVTPRAPQLGRLGNLLQGLEQLGIDALIGAMLVEAVRDPGAVAKEVVSIGEHLGNPIVAGVRDLAGL